MPRYFVEVAYKGSGFSGFQEQENADTIQGEINKALGIYLKQTIETTSASRTDSGVHAYQNFLHVDVAEEISPRALYNLNAILPDQIVIRRLAVVPDQAHARFDAVAREYLYFIHQQKNPFQRETSHFYPMPLDIERMNASAKLLCDNLDFTSFSKRHTDVKNFNCTLETARWFWNDAQQLVFHVRANRFLRGMVRGLVGTQLLVGRGSMSLDQFADVIASKDCQKADFSAPAHGLFLSRIEYPAGLL